MYVLPTHKYSCCKPPNTSDYFPLNNGSRFSIKAEIPSCASSEMKTVPKDCASAFTPSLYA